MDEMKYWLPIDWYNGGMEHTTLHLLYSRVCTGFSTTSRRFPRGAVSRSARATA